MSDKKSNNSNKNAANQKGKTEKKAPQGGNLPPLLEMGFSLASFLMVTVPLVVALVSYLSNATVLDIIMRMAVTVAGQGILLCFFLRLLNRGILKSSQEQIIDALEQQKAAATREVQA